MERRDQQLVVDYKNGDSVALELLIGRYAERIYRYIFSLVGDSDIADNLAQDTFVKMWKNIHRFRESASFQTWIYLIAKRIVFDFFRSKNRQLVKLDLSDLDQLRESDELGLSSIDQAYDSEMLLGALVHLHSNERSIILLYYFEHITLREISEIMEIPVNTTKSLHLRALKKLKPFVQR